MSDATGPLAPHVVLLHGRGATPPSAISYWYGANGLLTGVRTWWLAPYDDGGYPVDHYDLRRRVTGATGDWTSLGSTTDLTAYDRTVPGNGSYDYQVRAANRVGAGPWATASASLATAGVVVDGETTSGAPRALYLLSGDNEYPAAVAMTGPVTYDHEDPAVSPGGGELVYARSTKPGTGADGEYDLWLSSVGQTFGATPAVATQLTALPGAERDPAVSPDGATVAFTHVATDGSRSVWLVPSRGGGSPTLLLAGAANPAWTPDGAAVVVEDTSGGQLEEVPVAGGDPEPVAGTVGGTDPAVSRTGTIAFIDEFGNLDELTPGTRTPTGTSWVRRRTATRRTPRTVICSSPRPAARAGAASRT
jgi:hypothetical protein